MRQPEVPKKPNLTGWLWWLAILIAVVGGTVCYFLSQESVNPEAHRQMMMTGMITIIGVGVCVIAATAHLWMHR